MITHLATQAVYVADQAVARRFWVDQVGFEVRADHPMGPEVSWLEVAPPGGQTALVLYPRTMMPGAAAMRPSIVFAVDDVQATYEAMRDAGVHFVEPPIQMAWGTHAKFADPDGNEFLIKA